MDIRTVIEQMQADGSLRQLMNNRLAQFGPRERPFLGAQLLPEQERNENRYRDEGVQYRTIIANDATRYGPVQIKGGVMTGYVDVELGDIDSGSHFTGSDYDALLRILALSGRDGRPPMSATNQLLQWADRTLLRPLLVKNEKQRWEAIVDAKIIRTGDNNFYEEVQLSDPSGHRVTPSGAWSDNARDPYPDITAGIELLAGKGLRVNRIITSTPVLNKLKNNDKMKSRVGRISIAAGTVIGMPGRLSSTDVNGILADDDLPAIELYDEQYRTSTSTGFFLKRDVMVLICTTGREETIDFGDVNPLTLNNTLGYFGIGRAAGQSAPGRVIKTRFIDDSKPPRIEGEGWETGFPVVMEPEAIYVIKGIT